MDTRRCPPEAAQAARWSPPILLVRAAEARQSRAEGRLLMSLRQLTRGAGANRLWDLNLAFGALTIKCRSCNRRGRYRLRNLLKMYGPRAGLPDLRRILVPGGECGGRVTRVSRASNTGAADGGSRPSLRDTDSARGLPVRAGSRARRVGFWATARPASRNASIPRPAVRRRPPRRESDCVADCRRPHPEERRAASAAALSDPPGRSRHRTGAGTTGIARTAVAACRGRHHKAPRLAPATVGSNAFRHAGEWR